MKNNISSYTYLDRDSLAFPPCHAQDRCRLHYYLKGGYRSKFLTLVARSQIAQHRQKLAYATALKTGDVFFARTVVVVGSSFGRLLSYPILRITITHVQTLEPISDGQAGQV